MKASKHVCRYRCIPYYLVGESDQFVGSLGSQYIMQYIGRMFIFSTNACNLNICIMNGFPFSLTMFAFLINLFCHRATASLHFPHLFLIGIANEAGVTQSQYAPVSNSWKEILAYLVTLVFTFQRKWYLLDRGSRPFAIRFPPCRWFLCL